MTAEGKEMETAAVTMEVVIGMMISEDQYQAEGKTTMTGTISTVETLLLPIDIMIHIDVLVVATLMTVITRTTRAPTDTFIGFQTEGDLDHVHKVQSDQFLLVKVYIKIGFLWLINTVYICTFFVFKKIIVCFK